MSMQLIKRYVARNVLAATLVVLVGFLGLDLIFRIIDEANKLDDSYTLIKIVTYELMRTPNRIYDFMPMVGLIGCLTGLGALANSSELIVIRAAGVSTFRLLWVALTPALLLLLLAMFVGEYIAPKAEQMAEVYRAQARDLEKWKLSSGRGVWVRDGEDFVQVDAVRPSGVMYGVSVFRFNAQQLQSIVQAERASFNGSHWLMENVRQTQFVNAGQPDEHIDVKTLNSYRWQSRLQPELLSIAVTDPEDLQLQQLWQYIGYLKTQSLNSTRYELSFWEKVFYPLVMISLVITGISFVFGPLRQVTMGYRIFWGVLAGVLLKTLQDTLGPVSQVFGFAPMYAMLIPVLVCAGMGLIMLARVR